MKRILLFLAFAATGLAQKTPMPTGGIPTQIGDAFGNPCSGCSLYTYQAGGTTPQATYQNATGSATNTNPIVLNTAGQANIWTTPGLNYRFDLYNAASVLVWSVDNVPGGSTAGLSSVTANYVYAGPASGSAAAPTFRPLVISDISGAITPTTCTNQVVTAISNVLAGTCANVTGADFGSSIAARTALANNTANVGAPGFSSTVDVLAYQVAEVPAFVRVTTDFTTAASTALQLITGLTWTIPASTALNTPFQCHLIYNQGTANVAVAFGIQDVTVSPTNIAAQGRINTTTTAATSGVLVGLTTTTATAIVSATPGATATDYEAELSGMIEAPSNASSSAIRIMVSTATSADAVTVRQGSFCRIN